MLPFSHHGLANSDSEQFLAAAPIRFACIHLCLEKSLASELLKKTTILTFKGKMRMQVHLEDSLEVRYKLMSYGIPVEGKEARDVGLSCAVLGETDLVIIFTFACSTSCNRYQQCQGKRLQPVAQRKIVC